MEGRLLTQTRTERRSKTINAKEIDFSKVAGRTAKVVSMNVGFRAAA